MWFTKSSTLCIWMLSRTCKLTLMLFWKLQLHKQLSKKKQIRKKNVFPGRLLSLHKVNILSDVWKWLTLLWQGIQSLIKATGPQVCAFSHLFNLSYSPAMTAFVDATAGIILFTTPATFEQDIENMLCSMDNQRNKGYTNLLIGANIDKICFFQCFAICLAQGEIELCFIPSWQPVAVNKMDMSRTPQLQVVGGHNLHPSVWVWVSLGMHCLTNVLTAAF